MFVVTCSTTLASKDIFPSLFELPYVGIRLMYEYMNMELSACRANLPSSKEYAHLSEKDALK